MSGIELVGLAASVLQIADLGWKSSYKLYAFSKKIHDAGRSIELVSQDIAATGAILKDFGEELKKDEENTPASRLGTQGLTVAASRLVDECQTLFREIDQGITGEEGSKVILGFKQKLKWSYLGPRVDLLRTNLERLKSSLALMLNVLIYAEQHRSRQAASVLKEHQKLVASFAEQKNNSERRIEDLKKRIEAPPCSTDSKLLHPWTHPELCTVASSTARSIANSRITGLKLTKTVASTERTITANVSAVQIAPSIPDTSTRSVRSSHNAVSARTSILTSERSTPTGPPEVAEKHSQLDHHTRLFQDILEQVNSSKYALDHGFRYRLHDGVLELHWREWEPLRAVHGDEKLLAILSRSPLLARHWYERAMKPAVLVVPDTRSTVVDRSMLKIFQRPVEGTWSGSLDESLRFNSPRALGDEHITESDQNEGKAKGATQEAAMKMTRPMSNAFQGTVDTCAPKKQPNRVERAKYQFEADSEDEEMEDEIDANLEALSPATKRLDTFARATGAEIEAQQLTPAVSKVIQPLPRVIGRLLTLKASG